MTFMAGETVWMIEAKTVNNCGTLEEHFGGFSALMTGI
jgi:hypothetical protein